MAKAPFTYDQARSWLSSHPMEPHFMKFQTRAAELGDAAVPGMIEVLERGPIELHQAAAWVLGCNGIGVKTHGSTIEDFEYRLTGPGRRERERIVRPRHLKADDINEDVYITVGPQTTDAYMRSSFVQYFIMFVVAIALGIGAIHASGIVRVLLWVVAALLMAVTIWSVLLMSVMELLRSMGKRLGNSESE